MRFANKTDCKLRDWY